MDGVVEKKSDRFGDSLTLCGIQNVKWGTFKKKGWERPRKEKGNFLTIGHWFIHVLQLPFATSSFFVCVWKTHPIFREWASLLKNRPCGAWFFCRRLRYFTVRWPIFGWGLFFQMLKEKEKGESPFCYLDIGSLAPSFLAPKEEEKRGVINCARVISECILAAHSSHPKRSLKWFPRVDLAPWNEYATKSEATWL